MVFTGIIIKQRLLQTQVSTLTLLIELKYLMKTHNSVFFSFMQFLYVNINSQSTFLMVYMYSIYIVSGKYSQ